MRPETRDLGPTSQDTISGTRNPGSQYGQVGPGTPDPLSETQDPGTQSDQVGPGPGTLQVKPRTPEFEP